MILSSSRPETQEVAVKVERGGPLLLMGLNRPAKRNAFNLAMIDQLAAAYHALEADDDVRCDQRAARFCRRLDHTPSPQRCRRPTSSARSSTGCASCST